MNITKSTLIYHDSLVTPAFREAVLKQLDRCKKDKRVHVKPLMKMIDHLLLGTSHDLESKKLPLSWPLLNSMRDGTGTNRTFVAKSFFKIFRKWAFALDVEPYDSRRGQVRVLKSAKIPDALLKARDELFAAPLSERTVYIASGEPGRLLTQEERLAAVSSQMALARSPEAKFVLNYMNSLPAEIFDTVLDKLPAVYAKISKIQDDDIRNHQVANCHQVASYPKPICKPVEKTTRIFAVGGSFLNLKSCYRDELLSDWVKLDLNKCQLIVVSSLWAVPSIRTAISKSSQGLWAEIAHHCDADLTPEVKDKVKKATYTTVYGGGRTKIRHTFDGALTPQQADRFLDFPMIDRLFKARRNQIEDLYDSESRVDAFGYEMKLTETGKIKRYKQATSILACEAQSYELKILYPVVKYISEACTDGCPIYATAFLHDGIWIKCDDANRLQVHLEEIRQIISQESQRLLKVEMTAEIVVPEHLRLDKAA